MFHWAHCGNPLWLVNMSVKTPEIIFFVALTVECIFHCGLKGTKLYTAGRHLPVIILPSTK